uniref:Hexosyltransferase n=1 Tax=Alexandrium catenella TaxID=2925 RepID=A0A7S1PRG7_ALECA
MGDHGGFWRWRWPEMPSRRWPELPSIPLMSDRHEGPSPEGSQTSTTTTTTTSFTWTTATLSTQSTSTAPATTTTVSSTTPAAVRLDKSQLRVMEHLREARKDSAEHYGVTLLCFAVMVPWGNERLLLREAHALGAGIFGCEDAAIYSSEVIEVAPGVKSVIARDSLKCDYGGEFKTALNNGIFLDIWKKVVSDKVYARRDWTVKLDPDSVFFAHRLRRRLQPLQKDADKEPVYINNCKLGLHGPFEVLSRRAVRAWHDGMDRCVSHFRKLCSGDCYWGEDMFLDQCLQKVLHIKRVGLYNMLLEAHCDPPKGWESCHSRESVAFHPFKNPGNFSACLERAILG